MLQQQQRQQQNGPCRSLLLHRVQGRLQSRGDQYTVPLKIWGELRVYLFLSPLFDQMYRLGLWPRHSERVGQQKQQ